MDPYSDAPESHWDTSDFEPEKQDDSFIDEFVDRFNRDMADADQGRLDDIDDANNSRMYEGGIK